MLGVVKNLFIECDVSGSNDMVEHRNLNVINIRSFIAYEIFYISTGFYFICSFILISFSIFVK